MSQTTALTSHDSLFESSDNPAPPCAHLRQQALDNLLFLCNDTSVTIRTFKDAGGSWRAIPISDHEPFIFPELGSAFSNICTCLENENEAISTLLEATQRAISATDQYTETYWTYGLVPYHHLVEFQELEQCELDAEVFAMMYHEPCRDWDLEMYEASEAWMMEQHAYEYGVDPDNEDPKWVELNIRFDISEREATANIDQNRRRVRPSQKRTHCYLERLLCEAEDECLYHREARLFSEYLEARDTLTAAKLRMDSLEPEAEQLHDSLLAYERSENPLCEPLSRDYFFNVLNVSREKRRRNHIQERMQAQETVITEAAENVGPDSLTQHNDLLRAETCELNNPGFSTIHWVWDWDSLGGQCWEWTASRPDEMRQTGLEDAVRDGRKGKQQSKSTVGSQTEECDMEGVSAKRNSAEEAAITAEEPELLQSQDNTQMEDVDDESDATMVGNEEQAIRRPLSMSCDSEHGYYLVTPPSAGRPTTPTIPFASVLQIDPPQSPCGSESTYCIISPPHSP